MTGFSHPGLDGADWTHGSFPCLPAPQRPNAGTPIDEELVEGLGSLTDAVVHEVDHGHDEMICVPAVKIIVGYTHSCQLSDADGPVPVRIDTSEASSSDVDLMFAESVAVVGLCEGDAKPRAELRRATIADLLAHRRCGVRASKDASAGRPMRRSSTPGSDGRGPSQGYVILTMFFDRAMRMIAGWAGTDRW